MSGKVYGVFEDNDYGYNNLLKLFYFRLEAVNYCEELIGNNHYWKTLYYVQELDIE